MALPSPLFLTSPRERRGREREEGRTYLGACVNPSVNRSLDPLLCPPQWRSISPSSSKISLDIRNTPLPRLRDIMKATKGFPASHASFIAISRSNWTSYRIKFRDRKSSPCPGYLVTRQAEKKKNWKSGRFEVSPRLGKKLLAARHRLIKEQQRGRRKD